MSLRRRLHNMNSLSVAFISACNNCPDRRHPQNHNYRPAASSHIIGDTSVLLQQLQLGESAALPPPPTARFLLTPRPSPHRLRYALVATSVDGTLAHGCTTFYVRPDVDADIEPAKVTNDFHRW
jgi:hypothetical protein